MNISLACSKCGSTLKVPESAAGRKTKCPKCGAALLVPAKSSGEAVGPLAAVGPSDADLPQQTEPHHSHEDRDSHGPPPLPPQRDEGLVRAAASELANQARATILRTLVDFLLFRRMVVPVVMQALFWLGLAICVVTGIAEIVLGSDRYGILTLIAGPLFVRIWCELLIVIFRINETLTDILNELRRRDN